eukprot:Rhum_TRINITY_DN14955_c12_g1::Rhum_TRINITY_DN14955_c12_g1_i1::g.130076::m.130076/K03065/PSMC3, RPT5; 26S proteasome regulatory subunit T5
MGAEPKKDGATENVVKVGAAAPKENPYAEEDAALESELATMGLEDIRMRTRMLDNELRVMQSERTKLANDSEKMQEKIRENAERIKLNSQLPHLVATLVEILSDDEDDDDQDDEGQTVGLDEGRRGKAAVVKTSTRQTIYLPIIGLVDPAKLKPSDLVGVNKDTYLVLDTLPAEYDSRVKTMEVDAKPTETYSDVGGLDKQIKEMVEACVLPFTQKDRFKSIGIQPPKGVILYGPPGTGKTLLARACAAQCGCTFLKLAGPQLVQMFIGDGAKIVRDAFALAREKAPAIIFID